MKRFSTFLISAFILQTQVFSQVEITEIHPNIGDQLSYGETEVSSFDPGPAGANVVWDFSSFSGTPDLVANYQVFAPEGQSGAEFFPENSQVWFVNFSDTAELNFYMGDDPGMWVEYGFFNVQSAGTASKVFSNPMISYTAPLVYQNNGNDAYEGTLSFDGNPVFNFTGNVTYEVDGWGTLMMPAETYSDVLRVKTIEDEEQMVAGITLNSITTNYTFYTSDIPVPVLNISIAESFFMGELTETTTTVTPLLSYDGAVTGIEEPAESIELSIYPNPASDYLTLDFESEQQVDLKIINTAGKLINSQRIYSNTKVDISALAPGIYIAQILLDGSYLTKARFVVTR